MNSFLSKLSVAGALLISSSAISQNTYWQQNVSYQMDIEMDAKDHQFSGQQILKYTNNSPDTLHKVYYHLYFNAFQPGSQMDVRSLNIPDPDKRVGDRISKLNSDEIGYHHINSLKHNGEDASYEIYGTVMKVVLKDPILPGQTTEFSMEFDSQVPIQIRRSGRDNKEGIDYSMTQWYPKMAEYDEDGWHPDQYVGREFYGVWGDFFVNITIDSDYMIGGTGTLTNAQEIGMGYADVSTPRSRKLTWKFMANNVHDFAWAADPDYVHKTVQVPNGPLVHFLYDPNTANENNWIQLEQYVTPYFHYMDSHFGKYPYPQFTVIQGGDGGMEYPMATLIVGGGDDLEGLVGLFAHEAAHSWYYGLLGTNENKNPWIDEGFTTFAEEMVMMEMFEKQGENPFLQTMAVYGYLVSNNIQEPLATPGDHFDLNASYSISSYYMGALFLYQLKGIVGDEVFWKGMLSYYDQWAYKHPSPEDFIRVMELESDMELDWYLIYWTQMTKSIDYGVYSVNPFEGKKTQVILERKGGMPMPVDVTVIWKSGDQTTYTIPLVMMYNFKNDSETLPLQPWNWTHPTYEFVLEAEITDISQIIVDGKAQTCDLNRTNNVYPQKEEVVEEEEKEEE